MPSLVPRLWWNRPPPFMAVWYWAGRTRLSVTRILSTTLATPATLLTRPRASRFWVPLGTEPVRVTTPSIASISIL